MKKSMINNLTKLGVLIGLLLVLFQYFQYQDAYSGIQFDTSIHKVEYLRTDSLQLMAELYQGTWVDRTEGDAIFSISINPELIEDGLIKIKIEEYCTDGFIDYLLFEYRDGAFRMKGATKEGCYLDLTRIYFLRLYPVNHDGSPRLIYHVREMEYANEDWIELLRMDDLQI